MKIIVKEDPCNIDRNYIEIDLTVEELENIKKGRYPIQKTNVAGTQFTFSVGLVR